MKTKNVTRYLVNSYRAIFKKCLTIHNFGYMALVVMLVTSGINGAFIVTADIAVAQVSSNNVSDSKENFMKYDVSYRVGVHPKSSFGVIPRSTTGITCGTKLVIHIVRIESLNYPPSMPPPCGVSPTIEYLWLEAPQEVLEISENEITITEWSKLAYKIKNRRLLYFSPNGGGVLKIRKQGTSFHVTASFNFKEPSYEFRQNNSEESIDWTFLLNEQEGALLFSMKESNE